MVSKFYLIKRNVFLIGASLLMWAKQSFSSNPLTRGYNINDSTFLLNACQHGKAVLVSNKSVAFHNNKLVWIPLCDVNQASFGCEFAIETDSRRALTIASAYLLGLNESENWYAFSLDVGSQPDVISRYSFISMREILSSCDDPATVSIAGQATALVGWHLNAMYCGRCGSPSVPVDAGTKRKCTNKECSVRIYPRTDPCVNVLVISPDGEKILLGRRAGGYSGNITHSNLAGFIEQGESAEECAAREVYEESRVRLGKIRSILCTQAWPPGRSGSCELMIGVVAQALSEYMQIDNSELEESCWFEKGAVKEALIRSSNKNFDENLRVYTLQVPGPHAIAHHLMQAWVTHGDNLLNQNLSSL